MSLISKTLLAAACAIGGAGMAFAQDLSGTYRVDGRNPNGSAYSGTAVLEDTGDAVGVSWSVAGSNYAGRGTRTGAVLTVDWGEAHPVFYVITTDGSLHGTWANGTALEKLTPQ